MLEYLELILRIKACEEYIRVWSTKVCSLSKSQEEQVVLFLNSLTLWKSIYALKLFLFLVMLLKSMFSLLHPGISVVCLLPYLFLNCYCILQGLIIKIKAENPTCTFSVWISLLISFMQHLVSTLTATRCYRML